MSRLWSALAILGLLGATTLLAAPAPLSRAPAIALPDRIGWGGAPVDDPAAYLRQQLNPPDDDRLPPQIQARIDAMPISRLRLGEIAAEVETARQAQQAERKAMPVTPQPTDAQRPNQGVNPAQRAYRQALQDYGRQAAERTLLRAVHSQNQLKETLNWFWFNHFNVSQRKGVIAAMVGDYSENAIRPHVLGKFRDLLMATAFHPAMLQYLDNQQNEAGKLNENFARELMELHTMGVGSGYTQKDVQELARILTGVGVNFGAQSRPDALRRATRAGGDTGLAFNPRRHDFGDKLFLGQAIKGTGADEAAQALLILSRQPATARFISRKLAQFYCCDAPPDRLIATMAATFQKTDGDIRAVLTTLFDAPEFAAAAATKFKDPMHYVISAVRAAHGDAPVTNMTPVMAWLQRMGQPLHGRETPDGYPLTADAWNGPGAMETRFEIATLVGSGRPSLLQETATAQDRGMLRIAAQAQPQPPNLRATAYAQALSPALSQATRDALAKTRNPSDWNMLFLSSPEFMYR